MFEGLVAGLLNQHLGGFLEGIDPKQLELGVFSGK
jgi:VPS13-like, N-terminal